MSQSEESNFTYYAFVSYSHKDAKWAEWIQHAIEHYRLPAIIRKEVQKPLPKRIAPVFRDATDLGVDVLVDGLHEELEKSRFLIVVCSPNSAKPNAEGKSFVDEEVRHFCELGRAKQIIPVIIEGTPEESFGPVLKSQEILALDATKHPRARILNDIVAKILGLKPDVLWRRAERERKKRLVIRSILCGILGVAVAFIGLFAWDANRTVKNYYADYVDSFGLPEGIFPLKESNLAHRHVHYRFEYRGFQRGESPHADSADWCIWNVFGFRRRLVRVVQANFRGYPRKWEHSEYSDRPEIQDFTYDRDLRLREIRYGRYNGEGKEPHLVRRIELWDEGDVRNGLIKFFANKGQLGFAYGVAHATTFNPAGGTLSDKSNSEIMQHLVQRDAKGRVMQQLFLNLSGGNVPDGDGLYGFSYEYDDLGRQTAQWYLFRDGDSFSRHTNRKGVAGRRYEYAGRNIRKIEYVDSEGCPNGRAAPVYSFDEFDNNTEFWYFDGDKRTSVDGHAGIKAEYDAFGNLIRWVRLDIEGKPTLDESGVAEARREYDAHGNMTRETYFGVDGKPKLRKGGFAELRMEYDARGNITRQLGFGVDGKQTLYEGDFAEKRMEYDERGNMTRESYFGADGKPMLDTSGIAGVFWEYDSRGNMTREMYFGVDGKSMLDTSGIAEVRWEYDARGNVPRVAYFGVDGKPTLNEEGVAGWMAEYDAHGNMTRETYFGVDGKPTLYKDDFAVMRMEYDALGNRTRETYFGVDGKPKLRKGGFAEVRMEYDARGDRTRAAFFGVDGKPKPTLDAEVRMEYDARGNMTRTTYFGVDGKPTLDKNGIAELRMEYDARGNRTRVLRFGVDGKPSLADYGVAELRMQYDERGNRTRVSYFGADGNRIILQQVVMSVEVNPNLVAEKVGVKKGDVWCRLGDYDILKSENGYEVEAAIQAVRNAEKELVVARKVGDAYEIHSFKFPVGIMGIRVNEQNVPDFDKLAQAYKAYCEKEKQGGEKK